MILIYLFSKLYSSDLEDAAHPLNRHMQASWNGIVDDNDSLRKENAKLISQQKMQENNKNQKIQ